MKEAVAFIGLGRMGSAMAIRLIEAGHRVRAYNRTRTAPGAAEVAARGGVLAATPAEAVEPGGIAITMLSDDAAVFSVMREEVLCALGKGGVHVSMSTIAPATARDLARAHALRGVAWIASPVFGRPDAAAAGKLWIPVSGDAGARPRVRPLLEVLGQGVFDFGDDPGAACLVKLAGNFLIASAVEAMAEALTLAQKGGADPAAFQDMMARTLFACPIHQNYGKWVLERKFQPPGFTLRLGAKDMRLVRDAARAAEVPMPFGAVLEERYLRSLARGRADLDWMAISLDQIEGAGLA